MSWKEWLEDVGYFVLGIVGGFLLFIPGALFLYFLLDALGRIK